MDVLLYCVSFVVTFVLVLVFSLRYIRPGR